MAPLGPKRILLVTNVETGELGAFIAIAQSLMQLDSSAEVHLATFSGFQEDLPRRVTYHKISGIPMEQALDELFVRQATDKNLPSSFTKPRGFRNTRQAIRDAASTVVPHTGCQLVEVFTSTVDIIKRVLPDIVVVDINMAGGLTACFHLGVRFTCVSLGSMEEFGGSKAARLWKMPAPFTGFPHPVPFFKKVLNAYYVNYAARAFKKDPQRKEVQSYLTAHTILRTRMDLAKKLPENVKILVGSIPLVDYPAELPRHVTACGPIVRQVPDIRTADASFVEWLGRGRTIFVNMGVVKITEDQALQMAMGFKKVINHLDRQGYRTPVQVLWKLKKRGLYSVFEPGCAIAKLLIREFGQDRIRVVDRLIADPFSILRCGRIACFLHHGGVNSFNEGLMSGVPQVILPAWGECYDNAHRVELLGIGRWGNPTAAPQWTAQELAREIVDVLLSENSKGIQRKAIRTKQVCEYNGSGADYAALQILQHCDD